MKMQFLTVAAAMLVAAPMMHAQATTTPPATTAPTAGARYRGHGSMMKDLNLTADQQARIKAIHAKYAPQMKAARAAAKPDMDAMRAARTRGDTAAMRAAREKMRADMGNQTVMKQEMAEVRGVLTPDQQKKFDADRANMRGRMGRGPNAAHAKPAQPAS